MAAKAEEPPTGMTARTAVVSCGFNRSMHRLAEIVQLVCRSLVFFEDVH
jgi:hypothetical protein